MFIYGLLLLAATMADASAIIRAAKSGTLEEVRRLVQQDRGLMDAEYDEFTPLTAAAGKRDLNVLRYLLGEGAQVNLRDPRYWTTLDVACLLGHLGTVSLLLANGAAEPVYGYTPLMRASEQAYADIVALLLAHGCGDIDQQHRTTCATALHYACKRGAQVWRGSCWGRGRTRTWWIVMARRPWRRQ
jgi:ankyrin repeat protein